VIRQPVDLVLFDLGGTLIYEAGPWDGLFARADRELWRALHDSGVKTEARDIYEGSENLFDLYYKLHRSGLDEPTTAGVLDTALRSKGFALHPDQLRAALRAMFAVTQANWLPEEDAASTLDALQRAGYHLGLISNASDDDNTQLLVDKVGVRPFLEYISSSATYGRRKPDAGIFRAALDHFGVPAERAVMVGDSYEADILGAQEAGLQAIWITRRLSQPPLPSAADRADAVVSTLSQISNALGVA
jgi:HAD superfamily hydrolase (TIGR01549 family)